MGIRTLDAPDGGDVVVLRALRDLQGAEGPVWSDALGGATEQQIGVPLPVYHVGLEELRHEATPDEATPTGWRYLLETDGAVAFADVREDALGGPVTFVSLSKSGVAQRLSDAAHLVEETFKDKTSELDMSLLDAPAVKVAALKIQGPGRSYVPYVDGGNLFGSALRIVPEQEFLLKLKGAADRLQELFTRPAPRQSKAGA